MKKVKERYVDRVKCDICGYQNSVDFLKYTGVCHCCGKILDEKAHFKHEMSKKMRLWRGKKFRTWE